MVIISIQTLLYLETTGCRGGKGSASSSYFFFVLARLYCRIFAKRARYGAYILQTTNKLLKEAKIQGRYLEDWKQMPTFALALKN